MSEPSQSNQIPPLFMNPASGSADKVRQVLGKDARVRLQPVAPSALQAAIAAQQAAGASRVLVCGGDGTLALAAAQLAGSDTALGVIPGGTLNHFAQRVGIPTDMSAALTLALSGNARAVDVGYVNDHLFLNTSSVGVYVAFVRSREFLERRRSYLVASLLAGVYRLLRLRSARLTLNGDSLRTPLVFVGVGERELQFPHLGQSKPGGGAGLHMIAVRTQSRRDTLALAFNAVLRGIDPLTRDQQLESRLLDTLELSYRRRHRKLTIAVDGEMLRMRAPLRYRYKQGGLLVIADEA